MRITTTAILAMATSLTAQDWVQRSPANSPAPATYCRGAYDLGSQQFVVFGGWDAPTGNFVFQDTNLFDGTNWSQANPALVPSERCEHMMSYDLTRGVVVMYGGWDFNFTPLDEVLEWDGANWVNVTPAVTPPWRLDGGFTTDVARGVSVLFGGQDQVAFTQFDDTWEWNGTTWTQITTATVPTARDGQAMAYDLARGVTVMFGGGDVFAGTVLPAETWEYDGTNWTLVSPVNQPPARTGHQMVYDQARGVIVMYGGSGVGVDFSDTWEYDGRYWYQVFTATQAPNNTAHAMAYDQARGQTVVFGGFDAVAGIARGDTWEYGGSVASYRTFGVGCPGSNAVIPRLVPNGVPALGGPFSVSVDGLPAAVNLVYMGLGFSDTVSGVLQLPADLGPFGVQGCTAFTSIDQGFLIANGGTSATWDVNIPNDPNLMGLDFFNQAYPIDQGGVARTRPLSASNAGRGTIQ